MRRGFPASEFAYSSIHFSAVIFVCFFLQVVTFNTLLENKYSSTLVRTINCSSSCYVHWQTFFFVQLAMLASDVIIWSFLREKFFQTVAHYSIASLIVLGLMELE
ncbi:uncharacterized protein A4U43_C07F28790 [Asparagus officinalis]|uniref:Uncharacterized protein n=1 Tax=Asparagus officinalis TaxID=4686 RepID=A0A5P1EFZ9_ASPOF|nr:uncharacterized protein A4U43_C07F28790 [Asparagus officinalis]